VSDRIRRSDFCACIVSFHLVFLRKLGFHRQYTPAPCGIAGRSSDRSFLAAELSLRDAAAGKKMAFL
jgi:hypothetical protein